MGKDRLLHISPQIAHILQHKLYTEFMMNIQNRYLDKVHIFRYYYCSILHCTSYTKWCQSANRQCIPINTTHILFLQLEQYSPIGRLNSRLQSRTRRNKHCIHRSSIRRSLSCTQCSRLRHKPSKPANKLCKYLNSNRTRQSSSSKSTVKNHTFRSFLNKANTLHWWVRKCTRMMYNWWQMNNWYTLLDTRLFYYLIK